MYVGFFVIKYAINGLSTPSFCHFVYIFEKYIPEKNM